MGDCGHRALQQPSGAGAKYVQWTRRAGKLHFSIPIERRLHRWKPVSTLFDSQLTYMFRHPRQCSRSYSNISYVGAHNSYSVQAGSLAANQNYDVTTQLDNGIRLLQGQGHLNNGDIHLCHSSCLLLDAGTMTDYLGKVRSWLDANPNEVITILWVNSGGIPVSQWAQSYTAVGLDALSYTPASVPVAYSAWPTLQELISSGKRVVNFMDYGADYSAVPYILDHFAHFWENPYDQTDDSFPCTIDRGTAETPMYMINRECLYRVHVDLSCSLTVQRRLPRQEYDLLRSADPGTRHFPSGRSECSQRICLAR